MYLIISVISLDNVNDLEKKKNKTFLYSFIYYSINN